MKNLIKISCFLLMVIPGYTLGLEWNGQISGWSMVNRAVDNTGYQFGARFLPELYSSIYSGSTLSVDAEISANVFGYRKFNAGNSGHDEKLYRAWVRFSTSNFEARFGLQKINFGPAFMLRSLMWFDSLDPRDPQQLTDGVNGVLFRYYFINNANLWFWGLYKNEDLKGTEFIYSRKDTPEWGARIQYPLGQGEIAITHHQRKADLNKTVQNIVPLQFSLDLPNVKEQRYAVDGKWDYVLGFWFEAVSSHYEMNDLAEHPLFNYSSMTFHSALDILNTEYINQFTLGTDYTFGLGNGLHMLYEYMFLNIDESFSLEQDFAYSALLMDYPVSMFDQVMAIMYYDHENKDSYWYANWQRTFDNWSMNLMLFRYPDSPGMSFTGTRNVNLGKGVQVLLIYNF